MALDLVRLEVWTDLECAGGTRVGFFQPLPVSATWSREINGEDVLRVQLHRDVDAWSYIQRDRVLRARLRNGAYHEFRIADIGEAHERDGRLVAEVEAEAPVYDLGHDLVAHVLAGGDVLHDFPLPHLTPAEHLSVILGKTAGFPGPAAAYWSVGTVDFADRVDVNYRGFSALEAIHELVKKLADENTGITAEIEVTRVGTTGYSVGLRQRVGLSAERAYLRFNRNLHSLKKAEVAEDVPTRVYAFGQDLEGVRFDFGDARWEVGSVAGSDVALLGSPIGFDDQLNGLYLERPDGARIQIADTVKATQTVTLASSPGLAGGNRVRVCRNAAGDELTYLDRPGGGRVRQERIERPDIPPVDNLVTNPFLNDWVGSTPVGWAAVGGAVLSQVTEGGKVLNGASSCQIVSLSEEGGIETGWIDVAPTDARPFFLTQVALYPVEGVWRLELECDDGGDGFTIPDDVGDGVRAYTSVLNAWVERLVIQDQGTNFKDRGVTRVKLRLIADRLDGTSGQASCYFDAGQVVQTSLPELPFYAGRASRALWRAANDRLTYVADGAFRLDVGIIDLHRIDEEGFPHDELVLGGTVEVQDPKLGVVTETRIRKLTLELMQPGASQVELSDRPDELVDITRLPLGRRPGTLKPGGSAGTSAVDGNPIVDEDDTQLFLYPRKLPGARSVGFYDSDSPIDDATLLNNLTASNEPEILVHTFSEEGEKRYVSLVYFPGLDGKGKAGAIYHLQPKEYSVLNNLPVLTYQVVPAPDREFWRIILTVTDDGDEVYAEHRFFEDGTTPGAFTRNPVAGTVSDPHSFSFDVPKPATESSPDFIVHAYGYDADGNRSRLLLLKVRRNQVVSGNQLKSIWLEEGVVTNLILPEGVTIAYRAIRLFYQAESEMVDSLDVEKIKDGVSEGVTNYPVANVDGSVVVWSLQTDRVPYKVVVTPKDAAANAGPPQEYEFTPGVVQEFEDEDNPGTTHLTARTNLGPGLGVLGRDGSGALRMGVVVPALPVLDPANPSEDYLIIWDADADELKRVRPPNLGIGGGGGVTDHGALTGLGDNDHPQYPLKASTQTISGSWTFSAALATAAINASGVVTATDCVATSSDARLKQAVRPLRWALWKLLRIGGAVRFRWVPGRGADPRVDQVGILAQQVARVLPEAVRLAPDGTLLVIPAAMVALVLQALQELVWLVLLLALVGVVL